MASRDDKLFGVWHDQISRWVFMKNSKINPMSDTALNIGPTGLALIGEDMYVSGCAVSHDNVYQYAQCWKNGQLIFRERKPSNAMSIVTHNNDIYMAGYLYDAATNLRKWFSTLLEEWPEAGHCKRR